METALYVSLLVVGFVIIGLVILQGRSAGLQNRDASSVYRTKRGVEKTLHQATIALTILFLILSLISSLPIFPTAPLGLLTGILI